MPSNRLVDKLGLTVQQLSAVFIALLVVAASAYTVVKLVEERYRLTLYNELTTLLDGISKSTGIWGGEQHLLVQRLAREEHVLEVAQELLMLPREQGALLSAPGQKEMRMELHFYLESKFYEGYFIIAPDNISLASSRDANVGTPNLLVRYPELLAQAWGGETLLTPIQRSDVPLKRGEQAAASGNETMFVVTPIKDKTGAIIALLTLRINPYTTLFPMMEYARLGETGDSYAFDRYGTLLSRSRFEELLVRIGLLQPGESSAANLQLRDPGVDLTRRANATITPDRWPLTKMAAGATIGEDGIDLEGYRDYRGVPVVGAWHWNQELGFGFVVEQDRDEAYAVFYFMRLTTFLGAFITASIFILLALVFASGKRRLANIQRRLQAIVETAIDGIVVIDGIGVIESVNPATEKIFGYSAAQLVGNNVSMLMPEPHKGRHDAYLAHHLKTGEAKVIGYEREVDAQRSNGEIFPIELSVNRLELGSGIHFAGVIRDISERRQAEQALKREQQATESANTMLTMTQLALDRTGISEFWIAAEDGRVLRVNDHACRHLGYSREELLQLKVPDFDPNFTVEEYPRLIAPILEQGWGRIETIHRTKNGVDVPVEVIIVFLPDPPSGEPMSIAFTIDISERKQAELAIIQAREEAIAANRAKSTFLATMSHEIRTPLYGVVGTVDMLAYTKLDRSQLDLVNTAQDSAALLQSIIDDILDFSKIEAGRLELEQRPLSLEQLVEKLGDSLQHLAVKRGVELLIYCDPRLPEVKGDPVRLRQILYNLAGNAIKFSSDIQDRDGQVVISATLEGQREGVADICLRVSDNGIGMSSEVQQRLFMPFVQGEEETTRRFGGTGLGLVITERLVELMGGDIVVESFEGEGSSFEVHLSMQSLAETPSADTSDLSGLKVLLIKEDRNVSWMLTNYLQYAGAEVISVYPDEALSVCQEACGHIKEPVVVIDPEGDLDMARELRNELRAVLKDIELRFVLVERGRRRHARPDEGDGMTLDLNAMHRATLLNAVAAVAGRESPLQDLKMPQAVTSDTPLSINEAKAQGRLILLADDNATNRKIISQQLQLIGYLAETAEDGKEALEMWRSGSYAMLMTDCHMPQMDGYQLSEAIRKEEEDGKHIPIVAITADALKGTSTKCFNAGMDDYLTKPIQLHQLQQTLEQWLPDTVRESEASWDAPQEKSDEALDPLALGDLLGTQDREMLVEYYSSFIETSTPTVEQIRAAFDRGSMSEVGNLAHKMKSAARTVGANALADCCLELEQAGKADDSQAVSQQMPEFFQLFEQAAQWIDDYMRVG